MPEKYEMIEQPEMHHIMCIEQLDLPKVIKHLIYEYYLPLVKDLKYLIYRDHYPYKHMMDDVLWELRGPFSDLKDCWTNPVSVEMRPGKFHKMQLLTDYPNIKKVFE